MVLSGSIYLFLSTLLFTVMGSCVKALHGVPFYEVVFFRALINAITCVWVLKRRQISILGNDRKTLLYRGIAGTLALSIYFFSLGKLPFGLAVTLQHMAPVLTVFLSWITLGERPLKQEVLRLGLAFFCMILIQLEGIHFRSELTIFVLIGTMAPFFSAVAYSSIRKLNQTEDPVVIVFYFAALSCLVAGPVSVFSWKLPGWQEWVLLLVMGLSSQMAQVYMTRAYQMEPASKIVHINYLNIVWATLLGNLLWNEQIHLMQVIGMVGVILSLCLSYVWNRASGYKSQVLSKSAADSPAFKRS